MPFKKGNPGRPHGAVGKMSKTVRQSVLEAFEELQDDPNVNLVSWAREEPTEFYKIAAKLIPTEIQGKIDNTLKVTIERGNNTTKPASSGSGSGDEGEEAL